jgi:hypothetical protein
MSSITAATYDAEPLLTTPRSRFNRRAFEKLKSAVLGRRGYNESICGSWRADMADLQVRIAWSPRYETCDPHCLPSGLETRPSNCAMGEASLAARHSQQRVPQGTRYGRRLKIC